MGECTGLVTVREWGRAELELEATAFEVSPGCTVRLALACADWPNTIAPPGTWSALDLAACRLLLPVPAAADRELPLRPRPARRPGRPHGPAPDHRRLRKP